MNTSPGVDARLGEVGVLGEKTVARMDGLGAARFRGGHNAFDVEVALAALAAPDGYAS
jgi:hypothetical protein